MNSPLRRFKAEIFQALAHPTRIAILELLEGGELSAGCLIEQLGIEQANVSQHLAVLRSKQLVTTRKAKTQVFYSLRDPVISRVLQLMKNYFYAHLKESRAMLDDLESESNGTTKATIRSRGKAPMATAASRQRSSLRQISSLGKASLR